MHDIITHFLLLCHFVWHLPDSCAIAGFLLGYREKKPENRFHRILAWVCFITTLIVLAWAILSGIYILLQ